MTTKVHKDCSPVCTTAHMYHTKNAIHLCRCSTKLSEPPAHSRIVASIQFGPKHIGHRLIAENQGARAFRKGSTDSPSSGAQGCAAKHRSQSYSAIYLFGGSRIRHSISSAHNWLIHSRCPLLSCRAASAITAVGFRALLVRSKSRCLAHTYTEHANGNGRIF